MENAETIGGLVLNEFGELPDEGESVTIDGFKFTVSEVAQNRIAKLRIELPVISKDLVEDAQESPQTPEASDR